MLEYAQCQLINDKDEMLKSICADAPWCYEIDNGPVEPDADFAYARLSQDGYAGLSLASVDVEDWDSLKFLCNLVFPGNIIVNKARPDCLKITRVIQQCKWDISNKLSQNVVEKGGTESSKSSYIFRK